MQRENSTRFYDRNGVLLHIKPLQDGLRREYYTLDELPENLVQTFIQAEDKNFYHHCGIDFASVARAFVQNKKEGRIVSGASTITMQLARIIYPRKTNVSAKTKITEMALALFLEAKLSKNKILELYLNSVPFGFQTEGVASASRTFFSRTPENLSLEELKTLSQIPRRPSLYAPQKSFEYPALCPHFVNYVIKYYKKENIPLPNKITLSIDSSLSLSAEKLIQKKLQEFKESRIHNGAACAINNKTGEVFLWLGNASFFDAEHSGQIDGVVTTNQMGSSMKPFLYAMALENGFLPTTVLPDIPRDFGGEGVYIPFNFNNKYNGPVRMRIALASSLNIPAVYLLEQIGVQNYIDKLLTLGFASLKEQREDVGLSLALGGGEVSLLEITRAFSVFSNDGKLTDLSIKKSEEKPNLKEIYSSDTARIICDFLSDSSARELGFGSGNVFKTKYPCIFKTGTSNQFQNIIALGSTSEFTVGVWFGNFEGSTVVGKTGSSIPAQVARNILDTLTSEYGAKSFAKPKGLKKVKVCSLSGLEAGKDCPSVSYEFVKINSSLKKCDWHYKDGAITKVRYPSEYQHWANSKNMSGSSSLDGAPLKITFPQDNARFIYDRAMPYGVQVLNVKAVGGSKKNAVLYVDGVPFKEAQDVLAWSVPLTIGEHNLTVICGEETQVSHYSVK